MLMMIAVKEPVLQNILVKRVVAHAKLMLTVAIQAGLNVELCVSTQLIFLQANL
jgi:hypothetical protein